VEVLVDGLRRGLFGVGAHGDGGAVGVRAGDHEHVVAGQAVVAGIDVGRQVSADDVAHVDVGIGVGPGHGDKNILRHADLQNSAR
jgi:hypothetical protein